MPLRNTGRLSSLTASFALCAALSTATGIEPASADSAFGNFVGGVLGGVVGGTLRAMGQRPARSPRPVGPAPGATIAPADSSSALASLAPPTSAEQSAVLKSVKPVAALGSVGSSDDLQRMNDVDVEGDRDYTVIAEELVKALAPSIDSKRPATTSAASSDISEHALLEALDAAIRSTTLVKFETFRDESWSPERLRVMVLERLRIDLGDVLDSGKHDSFVMHDLETSINKAARTVAARLFETSELLAANRDSTLFLLRLYQAHGDVSGDVRERTEQLLAQAASAGAAPFEALMQRDANGYALHYRSERIVFDCLTENVEAISSGETGVASEAEIEKRILDVNKDQCAKWVAHQLVGQDGVLKPQEPMPLRVIWSAEGPRTDPSMFSRAPDEL